MRTITLIAQVLIIIGGLNWGLVGIAGYDLVAAIFGGPQPVDMSTFTRVIYALVGLGAVWVAVNMKTIGRCVQGRHV